MEEQKECYQRTKRTDDLQYIDNHALKGGGGLKQALIDLKKKNLDNRMSNIYKISD